MKFEIEASLKPPSFEVEYEIDRDEIRAVGRNIAIVCVAAVTARVLVALISRLRSFIDEAVAGKPVAASLRVRAPPGLRLAVPRQVYGCSASSGPRPGCFVCPWAAARPRDRHTRA